MAAIVNIDTFRAADGESDTLGCGSGFDVYTFDGPDDVAADCELFAPSLRTARKR